MGVQHMRPLHLLAFYLQDQLDKDRTKQQMYSFPLRRYRIIILIMIIIIIGNNNE